MVENVSFRHVQTPAVDPKEMLLAAGALVLTEIPDEEKRRNNT
jgi:hypothetical protein